MAMGKRQVLLPEDRTTGAQGIGNAHNLESNVERKGSILNDSRIV